MNASVKVLLLLFFAVCIGVHAYGLFAPFSDESTASHIIHLLSYSLCALAFFIDKDNKRLPVFILGSIYPWCYHALCAFRHFTDTGSPHFICALVVVILPFAFVFLNRKRNV